MRFRRKIYRRLIQSVGGIVCVAISVGFACAGELSLVSAAPGVLQVEAANFENYSAIEVDLQYQFQAGQTISTELGPFLRGALTALNTDTPGVIRLASISSTGFASRGVLLSVRTSNGENLTIVSYKVKGFDGGSQPIPTSINTTGAQTREPGKQEESSPPASYSSVKPYYYKTTIAGTEEVKGEQGGGSAGEEAGRRENVSVAGRSGADTVPAPAQTAAVQYNDKTFAAIQSGIATINKLPRPWRIGVVRSRLQQALRSNGVEQTPEYALAQEAQPIQIELSKSLSKVKPSVAVEGCRLLAISDTEENWTITLASFDGVWPARLLVLGDKTLLQVALVLVPNVKMESEWLQLNDNQIIPDADLNSDGQVDGVDAYIFVGNLSASKRR